ncbi:hypothetical protein E4T43_06509 [Aureobasidium subglaciale]|nr:hypothetical protein E4T43_06509 [Aureobasidium subglaciale]
MVTTSDTYDENIFRLMLRAKASDSVESLSGPDEGNERRRKAIESILFSRRFIITYNIVLAGIIAAYTLWFWAHRLGAHRRRRVPSCSPPAQPSIDSPKIHKQNNEGERAPLLHQDKQDIRTFKKISTAAYVRSFLIYQPANVPYINKILPSNATTIGILLLLPLRASYEGLNIIHRRLGEWMCLLALLHASSMVLVWYITLSARLSFTRFLGLPIIWLGILAFVSYEALYLTSLGSFRKLWYELFLGLHVILQAAALALLWFHHHNSQPYVLAALCIFAVDRLAFRLILKARTMRADLSILEDGETVMLSSNWQLTDVPWWRLPRFGIKSGWKPAEHVFLTIPALSHKHLIQAHPFTIASAAPIPPDSHAWLSFLIRAQDGFSRDLLRYAQYHSTVNVRIDGPYGSSHALNMLHENDVAVILAGGSGIAVAFPLVWNLLAISRDTELEGNTQLKPRVCLIWVVHDKEHVEWLPQDRVDELRELGCHVMIPAPTRKAGRPDLPHLLDSAAHAWDDELEDPTIGVVVAGPDSMNRTCRNACANLVRQGARLEVSVEKFGW